MSPISMLAFMITANSRIPLPTIRKVLCNLLCIKSFMCQFA